MIKLGITGGIGSGKSFVADILRGMNVPVYDTDSAAKKLMVSNLEIRKALTDLIGCNAYEENELNKPVVARFLFNNKVNTEKVNAIVHPKVYQDFLRWADAQGGIPLVAMECAILYESGMHKAVDKVLAVSAPLDIRLHRAIKRDNTTEDKIQERMKAQLDEKEIISRSDFVIVNDGIVDIAGQLKVILNKIVE